MQQVTSYYIDHCHKQQMKNNQQFCPCYRTSTADDKARSPHLSNEEKTERWVALHMNIIRLFDDWSKSLLQKIMINSMSKKGRLHQQP